MSEPNAEGLRAARAYAGWHLGYRSWADNIINAYLNPGAAMNQIRDQRGYDLPAPSDEIPPSEET